MINKWMFFLLIIGYNILPVSTRLIKKQHDISLTKPGKDSIPAFLLGEFMDDYGIRYKVTDSLWTQKPGIKYHIIKWNIKEQYLIAKNDDKNPSEAGLYSRIDYMEFNNMKPFLWGFCLTVYNAKTDSIAEFSKTADRENPKKGCGGYPFSRMKHE